jgi:alkanesulfonate monooxygenase SsuD/methylene tetrahydromethanopterin reductase-like flavin-dependent oxidoreductase (luciferase family)
LPHNDLFAIAFRSTVFDPRTIVELAKRLDNVRSLSRLFVPEGSQGGFTSLDICSGSLAVSRRLRIGSGVIRILEHDPSLLARRLSTLQKLSDNRFVLGIGTGRAGAEPKLTIRSMLDRLRLTRDSFVVCAKISPGVRMPEMFIATLRKGIARAVAGHSDGILLNFCPPEHAKGVINSLGASRGRLIVSCYLKIFYSRNERTANKMLIEEFARYNENPSYHALFKSVGVAHELEQANRALGSNKIIRPSENLMRISLANPTDAELAAYVTRFREAGVDLPCLYPYFEPGEDEAFKMSKVEEMIRL